MAINNSTDLFGPSPFIVNPTPGLGSYTTILSAVTAAALVGGTVYIQEGTYTESIAFPAGIAIIGVSAGDAFNVVIVGNHTFATNGTLSLQNLKFTPAVTSSPLFLINPSSGTSVADFSSSEVRSAGAVAFSVAATGSGSARLHLFNTSVIGSVNTITIGANATVDVDICSIFSLTTAVNLTAATALFNSTYTSFGSTDSTFLFSAGAVVGSICDIINSQAASYFARSTGAFGTIGYSYATVLGTTGVDPQLTKNIYGTSPGLLPITNGQLLVGSTGNTPVLSNLTSGPGIAVTNGAGTITIGTSGGTGLTWSSISANQTLATNSGFLIASGALSLALPTTSSVGDVIVVLLDTGTSWTITQAAGQRIRLGSSQTTTGVSGTLTSTFVGDSIQMVCTQANTRWNTYAAQGNITVI
jgi:hypothetical protein